MLGVVFAGLFLFQCTVTTIGSFATSSPLNDVFVTPTTGPLRPFDETPSLAPITAPFGGQLEIGALVPLSGPDTELASAMSLAADLARRDVNDADGTRGVAITVRVGDEGVYPPATDALSTGATDQTMATVAAFVADGVDAVVGGIGPGAQGVITETLVAEGVLHYRLEDPLVDSEPVPRLESPLAFRAGSDISAEAELLHRQLRSDGASRVIILVASEDAYGRELGRDLLRRIGDFESAKMVNYLNVAGSFDGRVATAVAENPDAIVIIGGAELPGSTANAIAASTDPNSSPGTNTPAIIRALAAQGVDPTNTGLYLSSEETNAELAARLGSDVALLQGVKGVQTDAVVPGSFRDRLIDIDPTLAGAPEYVFVRSAELYDAVVVVALAAHERGVDQPSEFAELINGVSRAGTRCTTFLECRDILNQRRNIGDGTSIDYDGPSGVGQIDRLGRPNYAQGRVLEFDAAGELNPIGNIDVFTG